MTDFFAIESLLIEHLKALQIPAVRAIYSVADLANLNENTFKTPCLAVQYDGYQVDDNEADQKLAKLGLTRITQSWLVVVSTNSKRDPISGIGNRDIAGEIQFAVIKSLVGKKFGEEMFEVKLVSGPKPIYQAPHGAFPLRFEVSFYMGG